MQLNNILSAAIRAAITVPACRPSAGTASGNPAEMATTRCSTARLPSRTLSNTTLTAAMSPQYGSLSISGRGSETENSSSISKTSGSLTSSSSLTAEKCLTNLAATPNPPSRHTTSMATGGKRSSTRTGTSLA